MSRYYRTKQRSRALQERPVMFIALIVCLLCWGTGYLYSEESPSIKREIAYAAGLVAVLISGFAIQKLNDREMLVRERTRLPFLIFFLFFSTNVSLQPVSETAIVLFCLIALLYELFNSYQTPEATVNFFNIGSYLGIAAWVVPQMLFFVPLTWIGMYSIRALEFKSFLASLLGLATVFWILLAWCVWSHDFSIYVGWFNDLTHISFFSAGSLFQYHRLALAGILVLTAVSCIYVRIDSFSNSVRSRIKLAFLINMSVLPFILIFLYSDKADLFQAIIYLPAAILISCFLDIVKYEIRIALFYFMLALLLFSFMANVWNF